MSQNQLIAILTIILLLVIGGSIIILLTTSSDSDTPSATTIDEVQAPTAQFTINLKPLEQQSYQLINKQLVKEGALPVQPPATPGKANPFL